ncbi:hypothetical protein HG531_004883 [Fusarium graminearum]|nr:hypothetical protein HG531_004883 [Fusarium graminearum]
MQIRSSRVPAARKSFQDLSLAHAAIIRNIPNLTVHTSPVVEQRLGVPLLLDSQKTIIVGAVKGLLPVGLVEVGLVHVCSTARSHSDDLRHVDLSNLLLVGKHVVPTRNIPESAHLQRHDSLAPSRENGIRHTLGSLESTAAASHDKTVGQDIANDLVEGDVIVLENRSRNQTTAVLELRRLDVAVGKRAVVEFIVVSETQCGIRHAELQANLCEVVGERSKNLVTDIVASRVSKGDRLDGKTSSSHEIDDGRTKVDHGRQKLVELGKSSIVNILVCSRAQSQGSTADSGSLVSAKGHGRHDGKVSSAATAQSPVQITVLFGRGTDDAAGGSNDFELEGVVGAEAKASAQRRVAAA